jgi:glycyl-tRNA synthetase beta chain
MRQDFLLEIGTEEIPAGFLTRIFQTLPRQVAELLSYHRLSYEDIKVMGTPRRLAIYVANLVDSQEDRSIEKLGPSKQVAYDAKGNPTKAAIGFARGQKTTLEELEIIITEKGEYLGIRKKEIGRKSIDILSTALPGFIQDIPFQKSMRWQNFGLRFARPIHWLLALLGRTVIPFSMEGLVSGNCSYGHRFMAPGAFTIKEPKQYMDLCRKANVIVDQDERQSIIKEQLLVIERKVGGTIIDDEELLKTVTNLVEFPSAACGSFELQFLELPEEVLITAMRHHQKYFSLRDHQGKLMPNFITINNTLAHDPRLVIAGNERVLRARLNDAQFFYREDLKIPLETFVKRLKNVVFQTKLGTSYEKMVRFQTLATELAKKLCPAKKNKVSRTALLCKADLESNMVGEFSDLQGIMGREYAKVAGEDQDISRGIYEHYLPTSAGGKLPTDDCGALVSIADKIDTIVGCFGIGLTPTGGADPYALRRQALGIIHIILDRQYTINLTELVKRSLELLAAKIDRQPQVVADEVLEFIKGRFFNNLTARGIPAGVVDGVLATGFYELLEVNRKIEALDTFRHRNDFELLLVAFKRVMNIIKGTVEEQIVPDLLEVTAEKELFEKLNLISASCQKDIAGRKYLQALETMAELKPAVDTFFDNVMVMVDDQAVKNNRIGLLQAIASLFKQVADFARL